LFSPQNRDYDVRVAPLPIEGPAQPATVQAPAKLPAGTQLSLTWFNAPENRFGGVNGRLGLGSSAYAYLPAGEAEELEGVRVPIWSTKSFTARWAAPVQPVVDVAIRQVGNDRLAGTVTNRLGRPLKDAVLIFGKQVYDDLGTIAPGASITLEGAHTRNLAGWLEDRNRPFGNIQNQPYNYQPYNEDTQGAAWSRADVIRVMMFRQAMGSKGGSQTSIPFRYLDLSGQAVLERPMLVAEVDGPAAAYDLGRIPSTPKVEQTSLVRIILPVQEK
jgi:hypothetical protein